MQTIDNPSKQSYPIKGQKKMKAWGKKENRIYGTVIVKQPVDRRETWAGEKRDFCKALNLLTGGYHFRKSADTPGRHH